MKTWELQTLEGWGRTHKATVPTYSPDGPEDFVRVIQGINSGGVIAFGAGRSYGDAALNSLGCSLQTQRLAEIVSFDPETGELVCGAGVTFDQLMERFLLQGFLPPVSPGTAHVTIGGAIANDVHGKNHDRVGSFGDHVVWMELLTPSGEIVKVAPDKKRALFEATVGGVGLTGIILRVCFRMMPVPSNAMEVRERRIPDLDAFQSRFVGNYELVKYQQFPRDGEAVDLDYVGRIMYDAAGNMAAQGMPRDLPTRPREAGRRLQGGFAYFGSFSIDLEKRIVTGLLTLFLLTMAGVNRRRWTRTQA